MALLVKMIEEINLGTPKNPKIIHFVASLSNVEKDDFFRFFLERHINFVWSYANMPRFDPKLVLHHFPLKIGAKKVNKKLKKMHSQVALLVKIELKKLLDVGFLKPVDYVEWISKIWYL